MKTGVAREGIDARSGGGPQRRWVGRVAFVGAVVAGTAGWMGASPATAQGVFVGACLVTIDVTFTPEVVPVSTTTSLSLDGSGTCLMEDGNEYPATVEGDLSFPAYTCAGGVAVGTVRVAVVGHPDFSSAVADAVLVHTPTSATLALVDTVELEAAAVGAFVQDPLDMVPCITSGLDQATWCGALVFEDPRLAWPMPESG